MQKESKQAIYEEEWRLAQQLSKEAIIIDDPSTPACASVVAKEPPEAYGAAPLFAESLYRPYGIESRRYIGNKTKLTDWIMRVISIEAPNAHTFCDIFAGTGAVANKALMVYDKVIVNDILNSNHVIYGGFFNSGEWDCEKLCRMIDAYNAISPDEVPDNWFSTNYGGKYFSYDVAKMVGYVRQDIENQRQTLTEKEYHILIATLIYSMDRMANTVGHFDAYIKKTIRTQPFSMRMINARSFDNVEIHQADANLLAKTVKADIVYLDPPYNSRQYSRFYHVYETLVKWNKPALYGVALKPKPENMSVYCTSRAAAAFEDLVLNVDAKVVVVSYNNTYNSKSKSSENKIRLSQIKNILDACGTTTVYQHKHQYFNAGKTEFDDHKEFLFVTKIDEEKRHRSLSPLLRWG